MKISASFTEMKKFSSLQNQAVFYLESKGVQEQNAASKKLKASSLRCSHKLVNATSAYNGGEMKTEDEAPTEAGPGICVRGIAMAGTEEFVSSKQEQK